MSVETKTVKTQPKQQHVISLIARFKNFMHDLHGGIMNYFMRPFQFLFCDRAIGAPGIPYCIPSNPLYGNSTCDH